MRQLEWYFSDNNLEKDQFMGRALKFGRGYMESTVFSNFSRVMLLTRTTSNPDQLVIEAAKDSEFLTVHYDAGRVFFARKHAYTARDAGLAEQARKVGGKRAVPPRRGDVGEQKGGPCKYFYAGYCDRGRRCKLNHSNEYARAMEENWLEPESPFGRRMLSETVAQLQIHPKFAKPARRLVSDYRAKLQKQKFRYMCVLDLEGRDEIIEFPVLVFDTDSMQELGRFHRWVRPLHLFSGKSLNQGSTAIPFTQVLREFEDWMSQELQLSLGDSGKSVAFVTCGDWDLKTQVPKQLGLAKVATPNYLQRWINIKHVFNKFYKSSRPVSGMKGMLNRLGMLDKRGEVEGVHHIGIHDVENIGRILVHMLEDGCFFNLTSAPVHNGPRLRQRQPVQRLQTRDLEQFPTDEKSF